MEIATKKFAHFFLISGIISFVMLGVLDMGIQMQTRTDGTMSPCLLNGKAEVCTMTFAQHLTQWQNMFTSTPAKAMTLFFTLLAIGLLILGSAFLKKHFIWALERMAALQKLYVVHHSHLSLFNPLREAFSQGILNPKIYVSAIV